jgi:SAM-dependent methyltransferase
MTAAAQAIQTPDYSAIKAKQNAAWASGDYARIGTTLQIVGETLAETMNLRPGSTVLDIAAGNGNATLAFARRFMEVTSTDYVDALLGRARARAEAEGQTVHFQVADAEQLPFTDTSFDAVASTFGVMFTPNQARAAGEMLRVCRPGGMIGMANWTPEGFIGQVFKTLGKYIAPPAGLRSPALWGTKSFVGASALRAKHSLSDIALRNISWTFSAPTMGRCTRPSWRSTASAKLRLPKI